MAVLPANSTLTNGTGTFSATLNTVGLRTITATDSVTASITGTSKTINVFTGNCGALNAPCVGSVICCPGLACMDVVNLGPVCKPVSPAD